jgi:hypothetical protein
MKSVEPHRLLVSDKVNLVSFIRQRFAKFCRQYTASAIGRVANNSYPHVNIL